MRDGRVIAPVEPDHAICAGDLLVFTGDVTRLDLLLQFDGLETRGQQYRLPLDNLVEVVVAAESPLARKTLKQADFRAQFDAAVIAVRRGSERLRGPIADVPLAVGDTLVLVVGPRTSTSATTWRATSCWWGGARCRSSPTRARAGWPPPPS